MKFEFSAGGIVYKKIKNHPFDKLKAKIKNNILILISQHSQHHGWVFPKGLIGDKVKGEKKETTAIREVKEETGIDAKIIKELKPITYWYVFLSIGRLASGQNKEKIKKTVYYYLMEYLGGSFEKRDMEMENVEWLPPDKVEERLTYSSDKKVWKEANEILISLLG